jgi:hypothetical protein
MRDCVTVVETLAINRVFCQLNFLHWVSWVCGLSWRIAGDGALWPLARFVVTTTISLIDYVPPRAY